MDQAVNLVINNGPTEMLWDSIAPRKEKENGNTVSEDFITIWHVDSDEGDDIDDTGIPCNGRDGDLGDKRKWNN